MEHLSAPLIDVLDADGLRTGEALSRQEIHRQGKIHRAVHLYLFDLSGNLLLQRRSRNVDNYPGLWGISVTGHVDAGEDSSTALKLVPFQDFIKMTVEEDDSLAPVYAQACQELANFLWDIGP